MQDYPFVFENQNQHHHFKELKRIVKYFNHTCPPRIILNILNILVFLTLKDG
jgi:hypothetical protein